MFSVVVPKANGFMKTRLIFCEVSSIVILAAVVLAATAETARAALALDQALDTTNLTWTTGGAAAWFGQTAYSHDGVDAAQSGNIPDGANSWLETTVTGPGLLTFWWKVSSTANESGWSSGGHVTFTVDGEFNSEIYGNQDWASNLVVIPFGPVSLYWEYGKWDTYTIGMDGGWLDQVTFTPTTPVGPTIINQPQSQTVFAGASVTFQVAADGTRRFSYQWKFNGTNLMDGPNLLGATNDTLMLFSVTGAQSGNYSVEVGNAVGTTNSANAALTVLPEIGLAEALDTTNLIWTTSGFGAWFGQTNTTHDGVDALQTGGGPNSGWLDLSTVVTGPGTLSFWWNCQFADLSFMASNDTTVITSLYLYMAQDWTNQIIRLPDGPCTLVWSYWNFNEPMEQMQMGPRVGWVDQVSYTPDPPSPPVITSQPQDWFGYAGDIAAFSVSAMGTHPFHYQWWFNGSPLPDQTNASLVLSGVTSGAAGPYWVVVSNALGSTNSLTATLTVQGGIGLAAALDTTNLLWTASPDGSWFGQGAISSDGVDAAQSGLMANYSSAYLQTTINGPGTVTFVWKLSDAYYGYSELVFYANGNFMTYTYLTDWVTNSYHISDDGPMTLQWRFYQGYYAATSWVDQVTYTPDPPTPPTITSQPQDWAGPGGLGTCASFEVVAQGTKPLSYQWLFNGSPLPGQTSESLWLSGLDATMAGQYSVVVSNPLGTTNSASATLSLLPTIPLDVALDTTNLVWSSSGCSPWFGQTNVSSDGVDAAQSGVVAPYYSSSLYLNLNGPGTLQLVWKISSDLSDSLGFYLYQSGSYWQQMAIYGQTDWQTNIFVVGDGPQILAWFYNRSSDYGATNHAAWLDQVVFTPAPPAAPIITNQPLSQVVPEGSAVTFSVVAGGTKPLSYQWWFNSNSLPGQTSSSLMLPSVSTNDSGQYWVVVSNVVGATNSAMADLTVLRTVSLAEALDATNLIWTTASNAPWFGQTMISSDGEDAAQSPVISSYSSSYLETVVTNGPGVLTFVWKISSEYNDEVVFYINGNSKALIYGQTDWQTNTVTIGVGPQTNRWLYYRDYDYHTLSNHAAWLDQVSFTPIPTVPLKEALDAPNLDWTSAAGYGGSGWFGQTNVSADGVDAAQSGPCDAYGSSTLQTTVAESGTVTFSWKIVSGYYDYLTFSVNDNTSNSLSSVTDWSTNSFHVDVVDPVVLKWTYTRGYDYGFPTNMAWVDQVSFVSDAPSAPAIVMQPQTQAALAGDPVTFTTKASGSAPLSYQWWFNSAPLAGQVASALTLPSVTTNDAGEYWVTVTNSLGGTNSDHARLTVLPAITLGQAVNAPELTWTTGGDARWYGEITNTFDGLDAAQSGHIKDSQSTWLETVVTGPGTLSFWWIVSSESSYDWLRFYMGGNLQSSICGGPSAWQSNWFSIPAGMETLRWQYSKDGSVSVGMDAGWVDQVRFVPDRPPSNPPPAILMNGPYPPAFAGGQFSFSFVTQTTGNYVVERTDILSPPDWKVLTNVVGNGAAALITDPGPLGPTRFYRVRVP